MRHHTGTSALCAAIAGLALTFLVSAARAEDALVTACKATAVDASIAACSQLLDTHPAPDVAELAWRTRGFRLQLKGEYEKSVADFTQALILEPTFYGTLTARGISYARLNNFDRGAADFDAALKMKPDYAPAFTGRSMLDFFTGRMDDVIADASEAIRLDPRQMSAYNNRGNALREKGEFDAALNDLNIAIRLNPYAPRPLYNRGLTYFRKGDMQHALSDYDAALTLNPNETDAANGRAAVATILAARGTPVAAPSVSAAAAPPALAPPPVVVQAPTSIGGALDPVEVKIKPVGARKPALVPSREPTAGTTWVPFFAPKLGLQLLIEQAQNPADRYTFAENGDWVEARPPGGADIKPTRVIRVLRKAQEEPVEQAIAETFIATLPPYERTWCKVLRADVPADPGPGRTAFEIRPTGAYGRKMEARMKAGPDGPASLGCGAYGAGAATSYFDYHPAEDEQRYLYVFTGFEQPFDERSIRLVPPTGPDAPAAAVAPVVAADDGAVLMQGTFAAAYRTASVRPSAQTGKLAVTLRVDAPGGCSGEAEGTGVPATPTTLIVAVPDPTGGPICTIDMIYDRSYAAVQVKESAGCLTWHGAQCDFVATLKRGP